VCLWEPGRNATEEFVLVHTPEAIDAWAAELRQRFGGRPVAICLEQTKGALIYALLKYDFMVLFPLAPARLASYRNATTSSGAKGDATDAALLCDYLCRHQEQLRQWKPDDPLTRQLGLLVEGRRKAVDLRTQMSNQLKSILKCYFPQAIDWVGRKLSSTLACDFLQRWPTLEAVQRQRPATLRKFYHAHNCRQAEVVAHRLAAIAEARPLTNDAAVIDCAVLAVRMLTVQLPGLEEAIATYDATIAELMGRHPDAHIFHSLPGAGPAMAPRLLAAFGTDRNRFDSSETMQKYSGIAPVTKASGKYKTVQRRWACPKFLRQSFHEFADHSTKQSAWARAYYLLQRERGTRHHAAIRALAFKWIRVIFRCWQDRRPYDESVYLQSLQARNSPLLAYLQKEIPSELTTCSPAVDALSVDVHKMLQETSPTP
jgi:transposase